MGAFAEISSKTKLYYEDTDKNVSFVSWKALLNASVTFSINIIKDDSEGAENKNPITVKDFYENLKIEEEKKTKLFLKLKVLKKQLQEIQI